MEPYSHHVLVCTGSFCSPDRRGRALYAQLAKLLEREDLLFGPSRVKRGETPCLGVCAGGPIVVVYPEGIWYGGVTPELLERIVVDHLKNGQVVEEAVFHRLENDAD
jgi:(2Fe-2S) ferredoxin